MGVRGRTVGIVALLLLACGGDVETFRGESKPAKDAGAGGTGGTGAAAGASGSAGSGGTGIPGEECSEQGALSCAGNAQPVVLRCEDGAWVEHETCPNGKLCDPRPGSTHGTCQDPVSVCVGKSPGDVVCDGAVMHVCGPNLLTSETRNCESEMHCQVGTDGQCAVCLPGEHRCEGALLQRCAADHLAFELVEDCGEPEFCQAQDQACMACHTLVAVTESPAVDMYIMADRSASMQDGGRWTNQSAALTSFFEYPELAGTGIGLRFFPLDDVCYPQDSACSGQAYVAPLVGWDLLPAHVDDLVSAVSTTAPNGCFTPTQEALNGLLEGSRQRQVQEPQRQVMAVMISDGQPCCGDCPVETAYGVGEIAAAYFAGSPSIRTFTVSVADAADDVMAAIAQQGGGEAFLTQGDPASILEALRTVRWGTTSCGFPIPEEPGVPVDPDTVAVTLTEPGGSPTMLDHVADESSCTDVGWYANMWGMGPEVRLCPDPCVAYRSQPGATVTVDREICE